MPLPVYSARLARAASFAGGPEVFFSAPAGFVTVVKCMSIVTGSAAVSQSAWIEDDESGKILWHFASGDLGVDPKTTIAFGEWVFLETETISFATDTETTADFFVSGYLLAT